MTATLIVSKLSNKFQGKDRIDRNRVGTRIKLYFSTKIGYIYSTREVTIISYHEQRKRKILKNLCRLTYRRTNRNYFNFR